MGVRYYTASRRLRDWRGHTIPKGARYIRRDQTKKEKEENLMRFAWHVHHNVLIEALIEPLSRRRAYIKKHKPKSEQVLRLKLLKVVRGSLPIEYVKAEKTYVEAGSVYVEAVKARAYNEAGSAYDKASIAYNKARKAHENYINALHAKECPDCPWDGETIFMAPEVSTGT